MYEIDPKYQGKINRLRNLPMYKDQTDMELLEVVLKKEGERQFKTAPSKTKDESYDARYKKLIDRLQHEYGVDMNESNDAESLKLLVKHTLQLEMLDRQINTLQDSPHITGEDSRTLKNLSDVQRSLVSSIKELSDGLGISRKTRKEKQLDDVPQFLEGLKNKAAAFWDRQTIPIKCENCKLELGRVWLNFPKRKVEINAALQCDRCEQTTIYVR